MFEVGEFLLKNRILCLTLRCKSNKAFLNILQLLPLGLVLGLSGLFLLQKSLTTILKLTLHLILVNLDPILVSLHSALVLNLHLGGLCLSKFDLLLHECAIFLEVDVLVIQLILSLIKFTLKLIFLLHNFNALKFILFLCLINVLLFLHDKVALGFDLVLESDLFSFKLCHFLSNMFILLDEFTPLTIVRFVLLIKLDLVTLLLLIECFSLLVELLVVGFQLLTQECDLTILLCTSLVQ